MKTTAEKIAVMQAFVDGKPIERRLYPSTDYDLWTPETHGTEPSWNWTRFDYRVKQEPLVKWAVVIEGENETVVFFDMKESALSYATRGWNAEGFPEPFRIIKMVEVPE